MPSHAVPRSSGTYASIGSSMRAHRPSSTAMPTSADDERLGHRPRLVADVGATSRSRRGRRRPRPSWRNATPSVSVERTKSRSVFVRPCHVVRDAAQVARRGAGAARRRRRRRPGEVGRAASGLTRSTGLGRTTVCETRRLQTTWVQKAGSRHDLGAAGGELGHAGHADERLVGVAVHAGAGDLRGDGLRDLAVHGARRGLRRRRGRRRGRDEEQHGGGQRARQRAPRPHRPEAARPRVAHGTEPTSGIRASGPVRAPRPGRSPGRRSAGAARTRSRRRRRSPPTTRTRSCSRAPRPAP